MVFVGHLVIIGIAGEDKIVRDLKGQDRIQIVLGKYANIGDAVIQPLEAFVMKIFLIARKPDPSGRQQRKQRRPVPFDGTIEGPLKKTVSAPAGIQVDIAVIPVNGGKTRQPSLGRRRLRSPGLISGRLRPPGALTFDVLVEKQSFLYFLFFCERSAVILIFGLGASGCREQ